jgi:hypothetical protein
MQTFRLDGPVPGSDFSQLNHLVGAGERPGGQGSGA